MEDSIIYFLALNILEATEQLTRCISKRFFVSVVSHGVCTLNDKGKFIKVGCFDQCFQREIVLTHELINSGNGIKNLLDEFILVRRRIISVTISFAIGVICESLAESITTPM